MADVTLRLIWYRLGEASSNMADRWEKFLDWYEHFSLRRVDILDMLFLGWLLAAFLVVGAINIYLKFFGRPKLRGIGGETGGGGFFGLGSASASAGQGESCQWVNSLFSWLYLHYDTSPQFVDHWLRSLNEQARKHTGPLQVKFERIQPGSLPPKFTTVVTEVATRDTLTVRATVEASDVTFLVSALNSSQSIKVSNCDVIVQRLHGQLKIHSHYQADQIEINATFPQPPDIRLKVRARNEPSLDYRTIEQIARNALSNGTGQLMFPAHGGYGGYGGMGGGMGQLNQQNAKNSSETTGAGDTKTTLSMGMPGKPFSMKDRRLLVKVIKANGLGEKDFGCSDPFCAVYMDDPPQKHTTSVVKSTMNPFWDEHFLLDLDDRSHNIKFEVFDREKPPGDDFLGRAMIPVMELRRMPSSRQIIPLSGRPGATGTITVEFLFMEPSDVQDMGDSLSPRRRIETARTMTPGGTLVTTTTTTTEKPRDGRLDSSFAESPNRIQKSDTGLMSAFRGPDYSPYSSRSSAFGVVEPGVSASQAGTTASAPNRPMTFGSPKVTVTQHSPYSSARNMGARGMTDSPSPDYTVDGRHTLSTGPGEHKEIKKSKSFASAIRKRFNRPKKPRSHSADRASGYMQDDHLLKPPEHSGTKTTDYYDDHYSQQDKHKAQKGTKDDLEHTDIPQGSLRKSRSHSFSNSLKRLFRKKKKDYPSSRESSVSRASTRMADDTSTLHASPNMSGYHDHYNTPSRDGALLLSTSVPVNSPLYDH